MANASTCNNSSKIIGQMVDFDLRDCMFDVRYEDMRADPQKILAQILDFTGTPCTEEQVAAAVEFARLDNMKKMEQSMKLDYIKEDMRKAHSVEVEQAEISDSVGQEEEEAGLDVAVHGETAYVPWAGTADGTSQAAAAPQAPAATEAEPA